MIRPPRIRRGMGSWQLPHHVVVGLGPAVAEELPGPPHLLDHVEIHFGDDELILVFAALGQEVAARVDEITRSEEHTSELQSQSNLVCRLLLEKKKNNNHLKSKYTSDTLNRSI